MSISIWVGGFMSRASSVASWILQTGSWNDTGVWDDSSNWID